jgi:hypothetical protein
MIQPVLYFVLVCVLLHLLAAAASRIFCLSTHCMIPMATLRSELAGSFTCFTEISNIHKSWPNLLFFALPEDIHDALAIVAIDIRHSSSYLKQ